MRLLTSALTLTLVIAAASPGVAQVNDPISPQSVVLASGLKRAFAAAQAPLSGTTQGGSPVTDTDLEDWNVGVYPIYVWLPFGIGIDVKNNELWIANYGDHTAVVFDRDATGSVKPKRIVRNAPKGTPTTGFTNASAGAYDTKRGEVLVPN